MARAGADLAEGMQLRRARRAEEAVPGVGTEAHDAGESGFRVAKTNRAQKPRQIRAERKNGGAIFVKGIDGEDEKNGGAGERPGDGLRDSCGGCHGLSADRIGCHWNMTCWGSGENFEKPPPKE